jgi:hypothetical protein
MMMVSWRRREEEEEEKNLHASMADVVCGARRRPGHRSALLIPVQVTDSTY